MKSTNIFVMIILVLLTSLFFSCSEREITLDQLQKRDELYYAVNEEKPYNGRVVAYYPNKQKRSEAHLKDGKFHGLVVEWYENGQNKEQKSFKNGELDGLNMTWYKNGQQKAEGIYVNGQLNGKYSEWYENGQKKELSNYKNGQLEGSSTKWSHTGQLLEQGEYDKNLKVGQWTYSTRNGIEYTIGIENSFELQGDGEIVYDAKTGLTWQRSDKPYANSYQKAQTYIDELNDKNWKGYNDWRLPTLKEAMTLVKMEKTKEGIHIDPIFDLKNRLLRIWTSDISDDQNYNWAVSYYDGRLNRANLKTRSDAGVLAVRSE